MPIILLGILLVHTELSVGPRAVRRAGEGGPAELQWATAYAPGLGPIRTALGRPLEPQWATAASAAGPRKR